MLTSVGKSRAGANSAADSLAVVAAADETTVKIESLESDSSKLPPIIGYFPTRFDPARTRDPSVVKVYKHVTRTNRLEVKVQPTGSEVEFVGTNYSGEASRPQLCNYALGVFDKASNSLKLVPIAANKIFRLAPKVGDEVGPETSPQKALTREEKNEAQMNLELLYSTKGTMRKRNKHNALGDDAETRKELDKTLEGRNIPDEALEAAVSSINERNVPPYDLNASDPSRAYPLEKIIFKGEWDHLLDVFDICQRDGQVTPEDYPNFVCNRVHKLDSIKNENEKKKFCGILSYITHLIKFKDKNSMDGVRSATRHRIPLILLTKFSPMFIDSGSKFLSPEKIELLVGYALVLTLFVDGFRTDLTDISKDLKMSDLKLRSYYESLGCKLVRENQVLLATLSAPLKFPPTTRKKRRKA